LTIQYDKFNNNGKKDNYGRIIMGKDDIISSLKKYKEIKGRQILLLN